MIGLNRKQIDENHGTIDSNHRNNDKNNGKPINTCKKRAKTAAET